MRVAIAYNEPKLGDPDSVDVLEEVFLVEEALGALGHEPVKTPFSGSFPELLKKMGALAPGAVFNLIEAVGAKTELHPVAAGLFEAAGYPFTGAGYAALHSTTDKRLTKALLAAKGIPTAGWTAYGPADDGKKNRDNDKKKKSGEGKIPDIDRLEFPVIVKPACEDASIGITDASVIRDKKALLQSLPGIYRRLGGKPLLVEQFIDGREFNVSLIEVDGKPKVLPPAEMLFANWPAGKPRIVNYKAKWHPDAFEYANTVRTFKPGKAPVREIKRICLACWDAFGLSGYARVDLRLDARDRPFVMEVNANPCIAPFSGFIQAAKQAGYSEKDIVGIMLEAAMGKFGGKNKKATPTDVEEAEKRKRGKAGAGARRAFAFSKTKISFRQEPVPADRPRLRELLLSTGAFHRHEIGVAIELLDDRLEKGAKSEYIFLFCEAGGITAGYACYGPITMAKGRFDLYWIAVAAGMQGLGIGSALLREAEKKMAAIGCKHIYAETASKKKYAPTREFYRKNGFCFVALVPEYYARGDDKLIFMKTLDA